MAAVVAVVARDGALSRALRCLAAGGPRLAPLGSRPRLAGWRPRSAGARFAAHQGAVLAGGAASTEGFAARNGIRPLGAAGPSRSAVPKGAAKPDEWLVEHHFEEIDSTQSYVERKYHTFDPTRLTAVSTDFQTAGRGTRDRKWESVRGQSVLMTFYFRFPRECETDFVNKNAPNVTKVLSVAVVDTLRWAIAESGCAVCTSSGAEIGIKWPNDVVANGHKIAGVVARAVVSSEGRLDSVIVGAGVNINQTQAEMDRIRRPVWPATSLRAITGSSVAFDVTAIRRRLTTVFAEELQLFFAEGFPAFRERINSMDALLRLRPAAREVIFRISEQEEIEGAFEGVDEEGFIVIRQHDGTARAFPAGELVPKPPQGSMREL